MTDVSRRRGTPPRSPATGEFEGMVPLFNEIAGGPGGLPAGPRPAQVREALAGGGLRARNLSGFPWMVSCRNHRSVGNT